MDTSRIPAKALVIGAIGLLIFLLVLTFAINQAVSQRKDQTAVSPTPVRTDADIDRFNNPGNSNGNSGSAGTVNQGNTQTVPQSDDVIAVVGEENIYRIDLENQRNLYAGDSSAIPDSEVLNAIAQDSVILQGGQADGLIKLDDTFYNSPNKNYITRLKQVTAIREAVESRSGNLKGSVLSIWFANDEPPALGYEQAKVFAREKITALHEQVKSGRITMDQAAQQIKNDTSLAQIDSAYKVNAIIRFDAFQGEPITISKELDKALWNSNVNQVTDVMMVKATPTYMTQQIDALYMFGQVTEKKSNGKYQNFDLWLQEKNNTYEITRK
jgi:hypothetical protein